MRARYPDVEDVVVRDGVRIGYEVYGSGAPTILLPTSNPIVHARQWKAQVPFLARHFRVVVVDGRGNGRSDRPVGPAAYTVEEDVADLVAVLDATGTDRAVVVGRPSGPGAASPSPRASGPRDRRGRAGTGVDRVRVVRPRVHPCRLPRLRRVLLLGGAHRPALHQAVRGRRRLEPGDHRGRPGRLLHRAGRPDARAGSRAVRRRPLPGARPARHRRPGGTPRDRRRGGRMDRRCAGDRARRRPLAGGARPA